MTPLERFQLAMTRRAFLGRSAAGIGSFTLAGMLANQARYARASTAASIGVGSESAGGLPELPHFAPKAKRMIYLIMNGAPSQMDLFDYKPKMNDLFDKDLPESVRNGQRLTTMTSGQKRFPIAPSMFKFAQHGQSGAWVSELLPHTAGVVDDLAFIKSLHTEAINHDPACTYIQTGNQIPGRPSMGSWLSYGLGTECHNLPAFVVMTPTWSSKNDAQALFSRLWGSGFLPSKHQGVALRAKGDPVLYLSDPPGVTGKTRRDMLDSLAELNRQQFDEFGDPETAARTAQYEMAFRMQTSLPNVVDISGESPATLDLYGPDVKQPGTFAASCLLARRLVEQGVRTVQIFHRGWDQHANLPRDLKSQCHDVDQGSAALIKDLKQRGLFEDTLVVWTGEFGRTVYCQGNLTKTEYGRDHHPKCFTAWMAGAGVKPGITYGATDDFSYNITENPVHIHELNATILHLMGIDHRRLSVKHQGLDVRLTGVEPVKPVMDLLL
ncbi:MAG: DUF1501 domain-containing protein [Pirellulales bacterium]|nr:DUF1501 domain-containing protein [Pirellulales bacterium]